jgi:hypothetical protein
VLERHSTCDQPAYTHDAKQQQQGWKDKSNHVRSATYERSWAALESPALCVARHSIGPSSCSGADAFAYSCFCYTQSDSTKKQDEVGCACAADACFKHLQSTGYKVWIFRSTALSRYAGAAHSCDFGFSLSVLMRARL